MSEVALARQGPPVATSSWLEPALPAARFILRGAPPVLDAASAAFEVPLSQIACRAVIRGQRAALWLGPDEQLLLAPESQAMQLRASLREALGDSPYALVDVSHRQVGLVVSGSNVGSVLNAGCPLDLDPEAFPIGMCTRTVLAKSEIILWRTGTQHFHLEVWRSFSAYVCGFLREAALEFRE
jgi:sarcosine oxidase, subunit gamma